MTVFDTIYRENLWAGTESRSGPGSGRAATGQVAREIVSLVADLGIQSVLDVGCGDGYWMPDLPGYVGCDVSEEAIRRARLNHPERRYDVGLPTGLGEELIICRDAIQHVSLSDATTLLADFRWSGARWLLASTFIGGENVDIATGGAYSPDLTVEPFLLSQPERLIFDGWGYDDGAAVRDPRKHLGLWRLT